MKQHQPSFYVLTVMRLVLFFLLLPFSLLAQNLVANGSFEEENICTEFLKNCAPEGWIISSLQSHFYFDDAPYAHHGQHFLGLVSGMNGRYGSRNFISTQLLCGLRKDASYKLEFYIMEGEADLDSAGVAFTADPILYRKFGLKDAQPSLWISEGLQPAGRKWRRFSAVYKANGSEAFLNIGLFRKSAPDRHYRKPLTPDYDLYIDSVSLVPLDPREKLCADGMARKEEIYEMNDRHQLLEKRIYPMQRRAPQTVVLRRTTLQRIDTLVIPDILFATNSYTLTPRAFSLIDSFARSIPVQQTDSLVIEGHTDSRGSRELNLPLSQNRAAAVATAIEKELKDMPFPLNRRGWAEERPVADNNTQEGRQKNRRVEVYLYLHE